MKHSEDDFVRQPYVIGKNGFLLQDLAYPNCSPLQSQFLRSPTLARETTFNALMLDPKTACNRIGDKNKSILRHDPSSSAPCWLYR
jgi:hypothetical protein